MLEWELELLEALEQSERLPFVLTANSTLSKL